MQKFIWCKPHNYDTGNIWNANVRNKNKSEL